MSLSLSELFIRILHASKRLVDLPTIDDETQELVQKTLEDLKIIHSRITELSVFSPNESLEDISSRDLVYLTVPYVFAEVQGRFKATNRVDRMDSLTQADKYLQSFIRLLEKYEIIPNDERALFDKKANEVVDFAKRRELKINQYKKEKDLKTIINTFRKRTGQAGMTDDTPTDYDILASLLQTTPSSKMSTEQEELDSDTDDILRESTLLMLRLLYAHATTELQSMEQELELLRNAPPTPSFGPSETGDDRDKNRRAEDDEWKLDIPLRGGPDGKGPIMDSNGRPLRPFTILPSDAGDRKRLQTQVFGPGYQLPTLSIDEYLEIERQRGNIITGGGPSSQNAPTSSEQLTIDSEMDGTVEGEVKAETKRQKDEKWARFTDENPRGAGNTMNRG